ncbi:MAG: 16S rRNA (adenine(1518)-N(6)/adenine(1519)-N(6))-dimethyltransferase RsmA [bacterium]|nr:16S rRNA (adenine(1518)-N(6)/adenine(1519)-N(6))-dimethyltransferase RsmA [bacterium]
MRAKKSLGQHFLRSERALSVIIETGDLKDGETVLEIGPGEGVLTEKLLGARCLVLAVEKDDNLFESLKEKFKKEISSKQLILIHDDILNFEFRSYNLAPRTYKLVANIPYHITGALLEKFLSAQYQPETMVLLVQKEVAQRIIGLFGSKASKKESILSISVKVYGAPRYVETVKAGSFVPMPKVDSAIILIENISKNFFGSKASKISEDDFFKILKAGFRAKRKKLSSNLSTIFPKSIVLEAFRELKLNENTRAEDLNVEIWQKLTLLIKN